MNENTCITNEIVCKYNKFGCKSIDTLSTIHKCVFRNSKEVVEIKNGINNLLMEIIIGDKEADSLDYYENYLKENGVYIISLNFWWKNIKSHGLNFLSKKLHYFGDLEDLILGNNEAEDSGAEFISGSLKFLPKLLILDFSWNNITVKGVTNFIDNFKFVPNLRKLDLGWNNLGVEGVKALCSGLSQLKHLEELLLAFNNIKNEGLASLCSMSCPELKKLDLSNNVISEFSCFVTVLSNFPKIEELYLSKNNLNNLEVYKLFQYLSTEKKNLFLETVDLGQNKIDLDGLFLIDSLLKDYNEIQSISLVNCLFRQTDLNTAIDKRIFI